MPLTRADFEAELVARAAGLMARLGLSEAVAGTNADLNAPIAYALRRSGYDLAAPPTVTDADLADPPDSAADRLFDLGELRLLESLWTRAAALVSQQVGPQSRLDLSDVAKALRDRYDRLLARIKSEYGLGLSVLTPGVIGWPTPAPDPDLIAAE